MSEKYSAEDIKKNLSAESIPKKLEPENIKLMLDNLNEPEIRKKRIRKSTITKITSIAAAFTIVLGTSVYFAKSGLFEHNSLKTLTNDISDKSDDSQSIRTADSYKEVYSYFKIKKLFSSLKFGAFNKSEDLDIVEEAVTSDELKETGDEATGSEMNYSDTYNQEEGVLEADIVKTDGKNIYYANENKIRAAKVMNGKFTESYTIDLQENIDTDYLYIQDLYIYNNKLVVLSTSSMDIVDDYHGCYDNPATCISFFNTEGQLDYIGTYMQEGEYNDVRMMSDGFLYVVSNDEKNYSAENFKKDDIDEYIPEYSVNGKSEYVKPECIVMPPNIFDDYYSYASYINIAGFNLNGSDITTPCDMKSVAGYSGNVYCTQDNLYVTFGYSDTQITRFSIDSGMINPQATGKVNGYVNDQFSMSEYNGYFRIAATISSSDIDRTSYNNALYVLDMNLNEVGSISDFGIDEIIRSVNFSGDLAYVVTFMQTDPLYAIDLSNPSKPVMLDEFKITGYSSYMQKWNNGLLFGFGSSADEDGRETGIKFTMFDNSNPTELEAVDAIEIDGWSEAKYERKALFINPDMNLIGFPVEKNEHTDEYGKTDSFYEFYSFENNKFVFKGAVKGMTHMYNHTSGVVTDNYTPFSRAVYIDGYIYLVSYNLFKSADVNTFTEVDYIEY